MKNQAKQKRSKKQSLSIYELRNKENKKLASVKQMTTELTQKKKKQRHEDTQNKRCGSKSGNFVIPLLFVSETY